METNCSKGWGTRCPSSKGPKCTCKCGGANHGKAANEGALPGVPRRPVKFTGRQEGGSPIGEVYHYKGYHGCSSKCELNIYVRGDRAVVMFTELPDNPGTSVTNMIEVLATQVYHERLKRYPIENIQFVECYPKSPSQLVSTYDLVKLKWTGLEFKSPAWKRIGIHFDPNKLLEGELS